MASAMTEELYRRELGVAEDNLARSRIQQRADSSWTSGNGESIETVVAGYQERVDRLREEARREGIRL